MASKRCPKCGLVNPATAERCDCGRSFIDGTQGPTLGQRIARSPDQLRDEADKTLRRARTWILVVGIMMFAVDQLVVQVLSGDYIPLGWKLKLLLGDGVILCFFVAMYVLAKTKPLAACIAALCGFWALHLVLAVIEPASIVQGLILKILFTIALVRGIATARRAQVLIDELAEVFE